MARARSRRPIQQELQFRSWGGARVGAGRKPAKKNEGLLPHRGRPELVARVPVHVTMRAVRGVPRLRSELVSSAIFSELARASAEGFRIVHFSIQEDHIHLIAEGDDGERFSRGMQRLASRVARVVNTLVGRRGKFWRERYHRRDLATPRQFRNALVYVTMNFRKHAPVAERTQRARAIDARSSALWLDDWASGAFAAFIRDRRAELEREGIAPPVVRPTTWIARIGWKRHGKLNPLEQPRAPE